jgi:hypothetical protein
MKITALSFEEILEHLGHDLAWKANHNPETTGRVCAVPLRRVNRPSYLWTTIADAEAKSDNNKYQATGEQKNITIPGGDHYSSDEEVSHHQVFPCVPGKHLPPQWWESTREVFVNVEEPGPVVSMQIVCFMCDDEPVLFSIERPETPEEAEEQDEEDEEED